MSCKKEGDSCSVFIGNSSYPGKCRFIGNGRYECSIENMLRCETKGNSCMEQSMVNGGMRVITGVCKHFANGNWVELGCKTSGSGSVFGSGSGAGSGSGSTSHGSYCQSAGTQCFPNILGQSYTGDCSYFYQGFGNYTINCAIDWNGSSGSGFGSGSGSGTGSGSGSGSGSGRETIPCNPWLCGSRCQMIVGGYYRSGRCTYVNGNCVCVIDNY